MDMRRSVVQRAAAAATNTAAILFPPIKRPLTVSPHPLQRPENPKSKSKQVCQSDSKAALPASASAAFDQRSRYSQSLSSLLSAPSLNSYQCRDLLENFTPHQFDSIFWEIHNSSEFHLDENEAFLTTVDSAVKLHPEATKPVIGWNHGRSNTDKA